MVYQYNLITKCLYPSGVSESWQLTVIPYAIAGSSVILPLRLSKHNDEEEGIPLRRQESLRSP